MYLTCSIKAILEQALYVSVVPRAVHPVPSSTKDSSAFKYITILITYMYIYYNRKPILLILPVQGHTLASITFPWRGFAVAHMPFGGERESITFAPP